MVDWIVLLSFGAFVVVVCVVLWAIALIGTKRPPRRDELSGELIIEYGAGVRILAIAFFMFPVPFLLAATRLFTDFRPLQEEGRLWLTVTTFFLLFSFPFLIEFFGVSHRLAQDGIRKGSPWSRKFFARWEDFISVQYSMASSGYILRTTKGTIRLPIYLRGIHEVLGGMAEHLPQNKFVIEQRV